MDDKKKEEVLDKEKLMHTMDKKNNAIVSPMTFLFFTVAIVLGIVTGYFLTGNAGSSVVGQAGNGPIKAGTVVGSNDTKTFKDSAQGVLQAGGIEGEGQYHLVRPGGDSQNVYLTSSSVDLSLFVNKKVKVLGETQKAQTAGWLMDVGRVEVLQ